MLHLIGLEKLKNLENIRKIMHIMAALFLCNGAGHYIFALWFLSILSSSYFPRLISAVGDWMSTILPHVVWP